MSTNIHASDNFIPRAEKQDSIKPGLPADKELKEWIDDVDFSEMVAAEDLHYLIARKVIEERDKQWALKVQGGSCAASPSARENKLAGNYALVNKGVLQMVRNVLSNVPHRYDEVIQELNKQTFTIPDDHALMPMELNSKQHAAFVYSSMIRTPINQDLSVWVSEGWKEALKLCPQPFVLPQNQD